MFVCHFVTSFDFPGVLEKMTVLIMVSAHNNRPSDLLKSQGKYICIYEGWNFNSGNYLFTTDTK